MSLRTVVDDILWEIMVNLNAQEFWPLHRRIEVKILQVQCHEILPWGGYHAVKQQLYREKFRRGGAAVHRHR